MVKLPKVGTNSIDRLGVSAVTTAVFNPPTNGGLGFIYRNLGESDVGVDGHIEVVNTAGGVTGKFVGVQIKTGKSWFRQRTDGGWLISIKKSVVHYWREYAVPVLLVAVDLETNQIYWGIGSEGVFQATKTTYKIPVLAGQRLNSSSAAGIESLARQGPSWLSAKVQEVAALFSATTAADLERHRTTWRHGRRTEARAWLREFVDAPARLAALSPEVSGKVLRFAAGTLLDEAGDESRAKQLIDEARRRDPSGDDARLRAVLLLRQGAPDDALSVLASSDQPASALMRALVLALQSRRVEALQVMESVAVITPADRADQARLRARLSFAQSDRAAVERALGQAEAADALDVQTRMLRGMVAYYDAIVPTARPAEIPQWPPPIPHEIIRAEPDAQAALRMAATAFERIGDFDWSRLELRHAQTWRLASLCALDRHEAERVARSILTEDPAHPYVISWAATESLSVDIDSALHALEHEITTEFDVQTALLYAAALRSLDRDEQLAKWLDGVESLFADRDARDQWLIARARAAVAIGDGAKARLLLPELRGEHARLVELELLAAEATNSDDPRVVIDRLEEFSRETGDAVLLFDACRHRARVGDWQGIIPHTETLLKEMPTPRVKRLVAFAYYNTRHWSDCAKVLDDLIAQPGELDVRELRRFRADLRLRSGNVTGTISDLQRLCDDPAHRVTEGELVALARAQFLAGHTHEFAATARRLRAHPNLSSETALMLTDSLVHDDGALARDLWRCAVQRGIADEMVPTALMLGFKLGLDRRADGDLAALHVRMSALAASGVHGVRAFTIDELVAHVSDRRQNSQHVFDLYRKGETATQLVASFINEPLLHFYHVLPQETTDLDSPRYGFALQFRDGSRGIPPAGVQVAQAGRLAVDLSGLLLAEHLDILDQVEAHFAPLLVPSTIIVALREQRDNLKPHQPSQLDVMNELLEAERRGHVRVWSFAPPNLTEEESVAAGGWREWLGLLERARSENAFVLDFALGSDSEYGRPTSLAGADRLGRLVSASDVRRSLQMMGALEPTGDHGPGDGASAPIRVSATGEVNEDGRETTAALARGATLYMTHGGAEELTRKGLLKPASRVFQLLVDPSDQDSRRAHAQALPNVQARIDWIEKLIRRVSDGLSDGRYHFLPAHDPSVEPAMAVDSEASEEGDDRGLPISLRCLRDIVGLPAGTADAAWIDDRWMNRHGFAGATRITDVLEVVAALEAANRVTSEQRWSVYARLRASNVRIIPLSGEELLHHVGKAQVVNGEVVETPGLRALRQSIAALLDDVNSLRVPQPEMLSNGVVGDLEIVRGQMAALHSALVETWRRSETTIDQGLAEARALWMVRNLYLDLGLLRAHVVTPGVAPEPGVSAVEGAGLLLNCLQLLESRPLLEDGEDTHASRYAQWIYEVMLRRRMATDAAFHTALVSRLREFLSEWPVARGFEPVSRTVAMVLAGRVFAALPEELRNVIVEDGEFLKKIGRAEVACISLGRWQLEIDAFAVAAAELMATDGGRERREVRARRGDQDEAALLTWHGDDRFEVTSEDGDEQARFRDIIFGVLNPSVEARRAACESLRTDADMSVPKWGEATERLVNLDDPRLRFRTALEYRDKAVGQKYVEMRARWKREGRLDRNDHRAAPTADIMSHLRLESSGGATQDETKQNFALGWTRAAETLLAEDGLEAAFARLTSVPIALPPVIGAAIRSMDEKERRDFMSRRLREHTSPIGGAHLVFMLASIGDIHPLYSRMARMLARRFGTDDAQVSLRIMRLVAADAFAALRRESLARRAMADAEGRGPVTTDRADRELVPELLASWHHAHQFIKGMTAVGADAKGMLEFLESREANSTSGLFEPAGLPADVSEPVMFRCARFLVAVLQELAKNHDFRAQAELLVDVLGPRLTHAAGEESMLHVDLHRDLRGHSNILGSFLQPTRDVDGGMRVADKVVASPALAPDAVVEEAVDHLQEDATHRVWWLALNAVAGTDPLTGEAAARFRTIFADSSIGALFSALGNAGAQAGQRIARQLLGEDDADARASLRESLIAAGTESAAAGGLSPEAGHAANSPASQRRDHELSEQQIAVLEALYTLAQAERNPQRAMQVFAADLSRLSRVNANYLHAVRPTVERLVGTRPLGEAQAFVPLLLEARGAA